MIGRKRSVIADGSLMSQSLRRRLGTFVSAITTPQLLSVNEGVAFDKTKGCDAYDEDWCRPE
jgi:hypothetical protein